MDNTNSIYILGEIIAGLAAFGSLVVQGMPIVATLLAIIWYLILILTSRPGRAFSRALLKARKDAP